MAGKSWQASKLDGGHQDTRDQTEPWRSSGKIPCVDGINTSTTYMPPCLPYTSIPSVNYQVLQNKPHQEPPKSRTVTHVGIKCIN